MEQYIVDTNSVSDYFSASFSEAGIQFMDNVIDAIPQISVITQIELLCWRASEAIEFSVNEFIRDSKVLEINANVIEQCVRIRKGRKIKTPDAIIAATAIAYNFILITNNEKDFQNIAGLKLINPHTL